MDEGEYDEVGIEQAIVQGSEIAISAAGSVEGPRGTATAAATPLSALLMLERLVRKGGPASLAGPRARLKRSTQSPAVTAAANSQSG